MNAFPTSAVSRPNSTGTQAALKPVVSLHVCSVLGWLVLFRPASAEEIDFDVGLRELQGWEGVKVLCRFLSTLGRRLGKSVVMAAEGDYGSRCLGAIPRPAALVLMAAPAVG
ncbi:hypothetical protein [Streptomyces sp. NPDC021020]|uniref:hypothetical protein n=1 Tax=Streptomyces sp. NPDC021020 TaxID=3365109 RepID=UPI00379FDA1B